MPAIYERRYLGALFFLPSSVPSIPSSFLSFLLAYSCITHSTISDTSLSSWPGSPLPPKSLYQESIPNTISPPSAINTPCSPSSSPPSSLSSSTSSRPQQSHTYSSNFPPTSPPNSTPSASTLLSPPISPAPPYTTHATCLRIVMRRLVVEAGVLHLVLQALFRLRHRP